MSWQDGDSGLVRRVTGGKWFRVRRPLVASDANEQSEAVGGGLKRSEWTLGAMPGSG
jgi:hypothetical protein